MRLASLWGDALFYRTTCKEIDGGLPLQLTSIFVDAIGWAARGSAAGRPGETVILDCASPRDCRLGSASILALLATSVACKHLLLRWASCYGSQGFVSTLQGTSNMSYVKFVSIALLSLPASLAAMFQ